jgi:hypothetical protein
MSAAKTAQNLRLSASQGRAASSSYVLIYAAPEKSASGRPRRCNTRVSGLPLSPETADWFVHQWNSRHRRKVSA